MDPSKPSHEDKRYSNPSKEAKEATKVGTSTEHAQPADSPTSIKRSSLPKAAQQAAQHHEENPDEISVVTGPSPRRELHRISSLVDPTKLPKDWQTRSPSGNLLNREEYIKDQRRPLSMPERQKAIEAAMAAHKVRAEQAAGDQEAQEAEQARSPVSKRTSAGSKKRSALNPTPMVQMEVEEPPVAERKRRCGCGCFVM